MSDDTPPAAHDPRAEADAVLGDGAAARVLEPSPPFDDRDPAYLADDPVNVVIDGDDAVVSPIGNGARTWDEIVDERADVAPFAVDRWLTSGRRLPATVPDGYHDGRLGLHRLAVYVLSPVRMAAIGKMALRQTRDGFGTPFFGPDDRQVRIQDGFLVDQRGDEADVRELTTLADAAEAVGVTIDAAMADEFDVPPTGDVDADLAVAPEVGAFVADWYGFAARVLETVRAEVPAEDSPSRVQLWPEHFDPAFEAGDEDAGRRAGFGASPGDHHEGADPEPYLYVSLWARDQVADDPFWAAPYGAKLPFAELAAADDQEAAALDFFRTARRLLAQ
jgi:hypothetical protein